MPIATFNPNPAPSPGTVRKPEVRLVTAEFGDGYTQDTRDGMNHIRRTIELKWEFLTLPQELELNNFFMEQGGDTPFLYTPSDETVPIRWTCKEWESRTREDGFREFSATLKQTFNLVT